MNKAVLLALLALVACGDPGTPAGPADSFPDVADAHVPEAPPGPEGQWMYQDPEPWGCDLYLSLNVNDTYAVGLACPSYETGGTDIFLEMGTYVDDGNLLLQMTPLASTCPGYPGEAFDLGYDTDPFVIFVPDELPLVPAATEYVAPIRYGCLFTDGSFQELPLTCQATGEVGACTPGQ